jgi:hypothetical protein
MRLYLYFFFYFLDATIAGKFKFCLYMHAAPLVQYSASATYWQVLQKLSGSWVMLDSQFNRHRII